MTTPSRTNSLCSICNLRILTPWVVDRDGKPRHSDSNECVEALRETLEKFLAIAGARIDDGGELVFTSYGFGAWSKRKGNAILQARITELERVLARQLSQMPSGGAVVAQGESLGEEASK